MRGPETFLWSLSWRVKQDLLVDEVQGRDMNDVWALSTHKEAGRCSEKGFARSLVCLMQNRVVSGQQHSQQVQVHNRGEAYVFRGLRGRACASLIRLFASGVLRCRVFACTFFMCSKSESFGRAKGRWPTTVQNKSV